MTDRLMALPAFVAGVLMLVFRRPLFRFMIDLGGIWGRYKSEWAVTPLVVVMGFLFLVFTVPVLLGLATFGG